MKSVLLVFVLAAGYFVTPSPGLSGTGNERLILVRTRDSLKAYLPDGTLVNDVGEYWAPSWSPDGTQFLALVQQSEPNERFSFPAVFDRSGSGRYLFPELPEGTYLYRPIWSPDGRSAALIRYAPSGFAFVVVEIENGEITAEGQIPDKFTADFPFFTAGIDTFSWSPDSRKLVFSWEGVLVFDIENKRVQVASEQFARAFWSPDGGGVCLLEYFREGPDPFVLGHLRKFELATEILRDIAAPEDIANAGIGAAEWIIPGPIHLSPDGSSIALNMGDAETLTSEIRIYDASADCIPNLARPRQLIQAGFLHVMEWAPDEKALAVIEFVDFPGSGYGFEVRVIELENGEKTTLGRFEVDGNEADVLGLVGVLAWAS